MMSTRSSLLALGTVIQVSQMRVHPKGVNTVASQTLFLKAAGDTGSTADVSFLLAVSFTEADEYECEGEDHQAPCHFVAYILDSTYEKNDAAIFTFDTLDANFTDAVSCLSFSGYSYLLFVFSPQFQLSDPGR